MRGFGAGMAATVPMTAFMFKLHHNLPQKERYPLPPRLISENLLSKLGIANELSLADTKRLTWVMHFGYGGAMGILYGLTGAKIPGSPLAKGIGFGLGVWAFSYLGLLPTTGLLASAMRIPKRRNAIMIAAHIVWGSALGTLAESRMPKKSAT